MHANTHAPRKPNESVERLVCVVVEQHSEFFKNIVETNVGRQQEQEARLNIQNINGVTDELMNWQRREKHVC